MLSEADRLIPKKKLLLITISLNEFLVNKNTVGLSKIHLSAIFCCRERNKKKILHLLIGTWDMNTWTLAIFGLVFQPPGDSNMWNILFEIKYQGKRLFMNFNVWSVFYPACPNFRNVEYACLLIIEKLKALILVFCWQYGPSNETFRVYVIVSWQTNAWWHWMSKI